MNFTQTTIPINEIKSCSFTGHRELPEDFDKENLTKTLETLIKKGVTTFYNGGAKGFDLISAEIVLDLKKKYPFITLILCIPCINQEKYYTEEDKKKYQEIFKKADEKIYISNYAYFKGCMQKRDIYLVDHCDILIAFLKKEKGGTAFTVSYCKKKYPYKEILFL